MRTKRNSHCSLAELEEKIRALTDRRLRMETRRDELNKALFTIECQLKSLYAKRTVSLNFNLPLS